MKLLPSLAVLFLVLAGALACLAAEDAKEPGVVTPDATPIGPVKFVTRCTRRSEFVKATQNLEDKSWRCGTGLPKNTRRYNTEPEVPKFAPPPATDYEITPPAEDTKSPGVVSPADAPANHLDEPVDPVKPADSPATATDEITPLAEDTKAPGVVAPDAAPADRRDEPFDHAFTERPWRKCAFDDVRKTAEARRTVKSHLTKRGQNSPDRLARRGTDLPENEMVPKTVPPSAADASAPATTAPNDASSYCSGAALRQVASKIKLHRNGNHGPSCGSILNNKELDAAKRYERSQNLRSEEPEPSDSATKSWGG